jgi:hypothetical protein
MQGRARGRLRLLCERNQLATGSNHGRHLITQAGSPPVLAAVVGYVDDASIPEGHVLRAGAGDCDELPADAAQPAMDNVAITAATRPTSRANA